MSFFKSSPSELPNEEETISTLGSTAGTFATRLRRRLREQAIQEHLIVQRAEERHNLILQAMTMTRRALQESCKIDLSDRFGLALSVSDVDGWPKLDLNLVDALAPERVEYALTVVAHDHRDTGTIILSLRHNSAVVGKVSLAEADGYSRLSLILKKSLRHFLDIVESYVLNPKRPDEILEVQARPIEMADQLQDSLRDQDVFSEDITANRNQVDVDNEILPLAKSLA